MNMLVSYVTCFQPLIFFITSILFIYTHVDTVLSLSSLFYYHRLTDINLGRLVQGDMHKCVVPPFASAVIKLLEKLGKAQELLIYLTFQHQCSIFVHQLIYELTQATWGKSVSSGFPL